MVYSQYTWIFACSCVVAFICAFGIGANDLANSFGSSVGTKAITMWQAVIIAALCEFLGAFFLGAGVVDTLKSGIAKVSTFTNMPDIFLFGMFAVMCAAGTWDNLACHLGLPVSTTHSTVGSIVGMALVTGGGNAVIWSAHKSTFPYFKGFVTIVVSWIVSPIAAGIVVFVVFWLLRFFVLRSEHSFTRAFWLLPVFVGATIGLIVGFITQTGSANGTWAKHSDGFVAWVSVVFAFASMIFTLVVVMPLLKGQAVVAEQRLRDRVAVLQSARDANNLEDDPKAVRPEEHSAKQVVVSLGDTAQVEGAVDSNTEKKEGRRADDLATADADLLARAMIDIDESNPDGWSQRISDWFKTFTNKGVGKTMFKNPVSKKLLYSLNYDVHKVVAKDAKVAEVWANAEVFDFKTERLFRYLQVFTAMAMSFAHGSNDVANAMGPFSAVYYTWQHSAVPPPKTAVPQWILAVGGAGIVCGLALYGYKIMRVLGVQTVKLTNARGFVCEWATALVVVISSRYGLPVSTTQVISGAIIAIGFFEGRKGVNWLLLLKIVGGWVFTMVFVGLLSALLTALGIFTPNKSSTNSIFSASTTLGNSTYAMIKQLNYTGETAAAASYNATLKSLYTPVRNIVETVNLNVEVFGTFNATQCPAPTFG